MSLRAKLESGETLFGAWTMLSDPVAVEIVSGLGFDWIGLDGQHGLMGHEPMIASTQAAAIAGTPVIIRVASHDPATICRALDAGAEGVIVPAVESAAEAERIVAACRYPPAGNRSWGPTRVTTRRGEHSPEAANAATVCIPMIESVCGLENVEEIVAVPGVDAVYVGPADLALSAGLPLAAVHRADEYRRMLDQILAACRRRGVVAGAHAPGPGRAASLAADGYRLLAVHVDISALREGAVRALADARGQSTS